MHVRLELDAMPASRALAEHASRRLRVALDHLSHRIRSAAVRVTDVNGPRGGVDKRCDVRVELAPTGTVLLSQHADDAYGAIDRAATRLKQAVLRELERRSPRQNGRARRRGEQTRRG